MNRLLIFVSQNFFKVVLSFCLLLITIFIGIYFLYLFPKQQQEKLNFEKVKYEKQQLKEQERENKIKEEEEAQKQAEILKAMNLKICLGSANSTYNLNWKKYCSTWKEEVDTAWDRCRSNKFYGQTDADNKQFCISSTPDYKTDNNESCMLPNKFSDQIGEQYEQQKEECYKLYK